ncbi:MAG: PadR family transcriptional regulator [Candidatus Aenigmatarchaeota archaeon]
MIFMRPCERLKEKVELENLWLAVLSLLKRRAMNGRELRNLVKGKFGLLTGTVTAYKVLYALEANGFVTSERRGKCVAYRITKKGRAELASGKRFLRDYSRRL